MTGFRNGVGGWNSDLVITKDDGGFFHLYLFRRNGMYSADNIIIKNYNTNMMVKINKYLPSPTATYSGTKVWNYGDDKNLTRIYPAVNII